jgi:hypothetical protein
MSASRAIAAVPISDNHDPLLSASAGFRGAISARLTGELSGSIRTHGGALRRRMWVPEIASVASSRTMRSTV